MTIPNLLGITGYARSGKDTIARHLVEKYGFVQVNFADKLRELVQVIDPIVSISIRGGDPTRAFGNIEQLRYNEALAQLGYEKAKGLAGFRGALQDTGKAVRDVLGAEVWISAWETTVEKLLADGQRVVCSDVRYLNEAAAIDGWLPGAQRGEVWRVHRTDTGPANTHESETELDQIDADHYFTNSTTVDGLLFDVDEQMAFYQEIERLRVAFGGKSQAAA